MAHRSLMARGLLVTAVVGGCFGSLPYPSDAALPPVARVSASGVTGGPGCHPASPITHGRFGSEVRGRGRGTTLYGLIMVTRPLPLLTGESVKIVWRMTGSGPLQVTTTSPRGKAVPLQFGPGLHRSSSYDRPGQEWGTGFRFNAAGCWHVHFQRTHGSADVWLQIKAKSRGRTHTLHPGRYHK